MKFLRIIATLSLVVSSVVAKARPSRTVKRQASPGFVTSDGGEFKLDGKPFYFVGTTAYWLTQLNTNEDIVKTLTNIQKRGIKVVRTWAFNEVVGTPPPTGTFISLWNNGVQTFNETGLQRLDFILDTAQTLGLKIQMVLTNNWAPARPEGDKFPRGFFSNDYGGIDTYVQQLSPGATHDAFYTDAKVVSAFKQYIDKVVVRYAQSPAVFSWEIANDPRCRGAGDFVAGPNCTPQTITRWTGEIASHIKLRDPNHMTASGDAGFYCLLDESDPTKCQKLNPVPLPPAQVSSVPKAKRNFKTRAMVPKRKGYLTKRQLLAERVAKEKARLHEARAEYIKKNGPRKNTKTVRGRWSTPIDVPFKTRYLGRRQDGSDTSFGAAYDGSEGVDTEDIMGDSNVDYSSFQFFPDQNTYSSDSEHSQSTESGNPGGTGGANYEQTVEDGNAWIEDHINSANTYGKPVELNGFGIVGQDSQNYYQPFDSANVGMDTEQNVATSHQQEQAYDELLVNAIKNGINGITHYQWGETGLESQSGSVVDDSNDYHQTTDTQSNGYSPDDGYAAYSDGIKAVLQAAATAQNNKSGQDTYS